MSLMVMCDGSITTDSSNQISCTGNWITVESTEVIQGGSLTPEDWEYLWSELTILFVITGILILLIKTVNALKPNGEENA